MSDYIPYVPQSYPGEAQPDPTVQMVLQATYGQIMHAIKDALDSHVHDLAEQAIVEFKYDNAYPDRAPGSVEAIRDYMLDLGASAWIEETAADIAPPGAPVFDIEMALKSILRASAARLDHAIRVTEAVTLSAVSA